MGARRRSIVRGDLVHAGLTLTALGAASLQRADEGSLVLEMMRCVPCGEHTHTPWAAGPTRAGHGAGVAVLLRTGRCVVWALEALQCGSVILGSSRNRK